MRKIYFVFVILMIALIAGGCKRAEETEKEIVVKEFEALTEINEDAPNVYLIVKALDNSYWDTMKQLAEKAAKQQGCNLYYSGSQVETEPQAQIVLLQKAVDAGADAIIIAPDDSLLLSKPIDKVYDQGIPVVLIDTTITTENYDVCYMTDNLLAGQLAAEEMLNQLKLNGCKEDEAALIAVQVGSGSSQTINERLGGFTKYWVAHAPEKWKVIDDVKINNGDVDLAFQIGNEYLSQYTDLKGMFGCNNGSTVGFAKSIMDNRRRDVVLVGFDYSDEMAQVIRDPDYCAATVLQHQDFMASWSIQAALDAISGKMSDVKYVDTGVVIVNKESIQTDEVKNLLLAD
ncbi:MAG: substrate-binding domain-containing protein [Lachnospiraceae bacterium]